MALCEGTRRDRQGGRGGEPAAARWQDAPAPDGLADRVRVFLDLHPESSWDAALRKLAQEPTP